MDFELLAHPLLAADLKDDDGCLMKTVPGRATLISSITWHGHRVDEVKSWLQKSVRRGKADEALYCALELYLFRLLESDPKQGASARRVVTNCLNRLLIMGAEDVGLAQPSLPLEALTLHKRARDGPLLEKRKEDPLLPPTDSVREGDGLKALVAWVDALCVAPKARALSDLGVYWKPAKAEWALEQPALASRHFGRVRCGPLELLKVIRKDEARRDALCPEPFLDFQETLHNKLVGWHGMESEALRLIYLVELEDPLAFYWCARDFVYATRKLQPPLMRRTKPVHLVWEILKLYMQERMDNEFQKQVFSLQQMYEQLQGNREAPLFLYQALLYCVWRNRVPGAPVRLHASLGSMLDGRLKRHLDRDALAVPDYAVDKHTKRGRDEGKTAADFSQVGALVANECGALVDSALRELYNSMYGLLDGRVTLEKHPWTGEGPVKRWPKYRPLPASEMQPDRKRQKRGKGKEPEEQRQEPAPIPSGATEPQLEDAWRSLLDTGCEILAKADGAKEYLDRLVGMAEALPEGDERLAKLREATYKAAARYGVGPGPITRTESDAFEWPQRVQVLTSKAKPDVYFALSKGTGRAVWVKGPFLDDSDDSPLMFQKIYNRCKDQYKGVHRVPGMEIDYMRPESTFLGGVANPEGFGTRTKVRAGRAYPFLVADDIASPARRTPYQVKEYGKSGKCWPAETELADPQASGSGCVQLNSATADQLKDEVQIQVLLVLLLRYAWEVNDTCDRNVLIDLGSSKVYGVDAEGRRKSTGSLYKRPLGKEAKGAMRRVVERHWGTVYQQYLTEWLQVAMDADAHQPAYVTRNLAELVCGGKEALIKLL